MLQKYLKSEVQCSKKDFKQAVKRYGKDCLTKKDENGQTVLHVAAQLGNKLVVSMLLNNFKANKEELDIVGKTPLLCAILSGDLDTIQCLLEKGCKVTGSVLHHLTKIESTNGSNNYQKVVKRIVALAPDLEAKNQYGETALHLAARNGTLDLVSLLISQKANVNALDSSNETPLHIAARAGRKEIVSLLIENGADISLKGNDGTPRSVALKSKEMEVTTLLEEYENKLSNNKQPNKRASRVALKSDNNSVVAVDTSRSRNEPESQSSDESNNTESSGEDKHISDTDSISLELRTVSPIVAPRAETNFRVHKDLAHSSSFDKRCSVTFARSSPQIAVAKSHIKYKSVFESEIKPVRKTLNQGFVFIQKV
eukprot:TRINITY_DN4202_c0_g1_i1.p1 TRINITY_DN4202_c0_g1~~TRINITY_DN4202_c0_g1_i1.p1  ORF type:complete len:369 (-),score=47.20 TRINITY_DN4202_c0_g1_i1:164-1270(-)